MAGTTLLQDGDLDSAANFSAMHGRANAGDYVEFGMELLYDSSVPEVTVRDGKAFVLLDREEDSQDPGSYRRRVGKGFDIDVDETHTLQSNATNYVWAVSNESTENSGGQQDQPYYDVTQTNSPPVDPPLADGCLLIGTIDTTDDVVTPFNREPDVAAETVDVIDDVTVGGDLALTGTKSSLTLGQGAGPHKIDFGSDTSDTLSLSHPTADDEFEVMWNDDAVVTVDAPNGDMMVPDGSLTVGGSVEFLPQSGTALDLRPNSDGSHFLWKHDDGGVRTREYGAQSDPANDNAFELERLLEDSQNVPLFRVGTSGEVVVPNGPLNLNDNLVTGVEGLIFNEDGRQNIDYDGTAGSFQIRDAANNDERVLSVGKGQMQIGRTVNLQDSDVVNATSVSFSSSSGTALDLTRNSDGSHFLWKHDDGTSNPTQYSAQLQAGGGNAYQIRNDTTDENLFRVRNDGDIRWKVLNGAVVNGGHGSFDTAQEAVDYAINNGYTAVEFPPGQYGSIVFSEALEIRGQSYGPGGESPEALFTAGDSPAIDGGNDCRIKDVAVETNDGQQFSVIVRDNSSVESTRVNKGGAITADGNSGLISGCSARINQLTDEGVILTTDAKNVIVDGNHTMGSIRDNGTGNVIGENT